VSRSLLHGCYTVATSTNSVSREAYAGAAPVIPRASGKSLTVTHRRVKNQRLAAVGYVWAFAALTASPGARAHYDRRKTTGDRHTAAQCNLFNRLLGCLHTRQLCNEQMAFPTTDNWSVPDFIDTGLGCQIG
jgi:hypothetical protein